MKAQEKKWCEGTRILLKNEIPLETPITISIEASSLCNLKCNYCLHGVQNGNFPKQLMNFDLFVKAIDSLAGFPQKIKNIVFALNGEPFTNPQLPEMIRYIKQKNIADKVTVFTNAILLNEEIGQAVIDAGLDILRVSIQGVSSENYQTLCNTKVDYQRIVENVARLYKYKEDNRINCHFFVKVVDQSLKDKSEEIKFYNDFGDICDQISIETIVPIRIEVDYSNQEVTVDKNLVKQRHQGADVCPQPFYGMYLRSNGTVIACCIADINKQVIGDAARDGLPDIWKSKALQDIRKQQLLRKRYENSECKKCSYPDCGMQTNDNIDDVAEILLEKMFGENNEYGMRDHIH